MTDKNKELAEGWGRLLLACQTAYSLCASASPLFAILFLLYGSWRDSWTATVSGLAMLLYAYKALPTVWDLISGGVAQKGAGDVLRAMIAQATMNQTKH